MLLDRFLPRAEFREVHTIWVAASPERALQAFKEVTPEEMPLARLLFRIRGVRARVGGRPLYGQLLAEGFIVLAEEPGEVVLGAVGQFWKLRGSSVPAARDPGRFLAFAAPPRASSCSESIVRCGSPHSHPESTTGRERCPPPLPRRACAHARSRLLRLLHRDRSRSR